MVQQMKIADVGHLAENTDYHTYLIALSVHNLHVTRKYLITKIRPDFNLNLEVRHPIIMLFN